MNHGPSQSLYFKVPQMMCTQSCVPLIQLILNRANWISHSEVGFPGEGEGYVRVTIDADKSAQDVINLIYNIPRDTRFEAQLADDPALRRKSRFGM